MKVEIGYNELEKMIKEFYYKKFENSKISVGSLSSISVIPREFQKEEVYVTTIHHIVSVKIRAQYKDKAIDIMYDLNKAQIKRIVKAYFDSVRKFEAPTRINPMNPNIIRKISSVSFDTKEPRGKVKAKRKSNDSIFSLASYQKESN